MNIHSIVSVLGWIWKCNVPRTIHACAGEKVSVSELCTNDIHQNILHLSFLCMYSSWPIYWTTSCLRIHRKVHLSCAVNWKKKAETNMNMSEYFSQSLISSKQADITTPAQHVNIRWLAGKLEDCSTALLKGWGSFRRREDHFLGEGELWLWHLLLQTTTVRLLAHVTVHLRQNGE